MKYRNLKTGAVINIASVLNGEDWEEVKEVEVEKTEPVKKTSKRKKGDDA